MTTDLFRDLAAQYRFRPIRFVVERSGYPIFVFQMFPLRRPGWIQELFLWIAGSSTWLGVSHWGKPIRCNLIKGVLGDENVPKQNAQLNGCFSRSRLL